MTRVIKGFVSPFHGIAFLIKKPRLQVLALLPVFFTLVLALGTIGFALFLVPSWIPQFTVFSTAPAWLNWGTGFLLKILSVLFSLVLGVITSYYLGRLLALPFYSWLAEFTLRESGHLKNPPCISVQIFKSVLKTLVLLPVTIVLVLASWIPGVGWVGLFGAFYLIAFDCVDYALELRYASLRDRITVGFRHAPELFGLSIAIALIFSVPILNFVLLPAIIVGGSLLATDWWDEERSL